MIELPPFTKDGVLPPADYVFTFEELKQTYLILGPHPKSDYPDWDVTWRLHLVENTKIICDQLFTVGITEIFINGSFVEDKDHPNDIDGYFECDALFFLSGDLERKLNELASHKIWTWDPGTRRPYRSYFKKQLPMWHQYRVDFYPYWEGQLSGIQDKKGTNLSFPQAFRLSREFKEKGVIKIINS